MGKKRVEEIETVKRTYKDLFLRGLAALLPTILTFYVLIICWQALDQNIAQPINGGIKTFLKETSVGNYVAVRAFDLDINQRQGPALDRAIDQSYQRWIGLVAAVLIVLVVGAFITSFLGRKIWEIIERRLVRIPVVRAIYPYAKQLTDFFFAPEEKKKKGFSSVCAIQFPQEGVWTIAFVTGEGVPGMEEVAGSEVSTVFVPFAPTPFTGYVISVPREDIVSLSISVDEALRMYVSCGVLVPGAEEAELPEGIEPGSVPAPPPGTFRGEGSPAADDGDGGAGDPGTEAEGEEGPGEPDGPNEGSPGP